MNFPFMSKVCMSDSNHLGTPHIPIFILESQPIFNKGLKLLFATQSDFYPFFLPQPFEELETQISIHHPKLLLYGYNQENMTALQQLKTLCQINKIALIVLSSFKDYQSIISIIKLGVQGFSLKEQAGIDLLEHLKAVYQNKIVIESWIPLSLIQAAHPVLPQAISSGSSCPLSGREFDVAVCVTRGMSGPQASQQLNLSARTIERYRKNILDKLHLPGIIALQKWGLTVGLDQIPLPLPSCASEQND